jgi:hypothetical protein
MLTTRGHVAVQRAGSVAAHYKVTRALPRSIDARVAAW